MDNPTQQVEIKLCSSVFLPLHHTLVNQQQICNDRLPRIITVLCAVNKRSYVVLMMNPQLEYDIASIKTQEQNFLI